MNRQKLKASQVSLMQRFKRQKKKVCYYCKKKLTDPFDTTVDHKIPTCKGGITKYSNLVIACRHCNEEKANMTEEEYMTFKSNKNK